MLKDGKCEEGIEKIQNPVDKLLTTSAFRRQFKINGQIGEPEQRDKLSYTSLVRQIQTGISQGYQEEEIVDGIIRAITPGMVLRRYLETFKDLSLDRLKKILRSHYGVKNTTELYQNLASATQEPKETPQTFLMRALDLRQQILFACYEGGDDKSLKYDPMHVQNLFLRTIETGLQDENIRTKIRPFLEKSDVEDELLIHELNKAVSAESERVKKMKTNRGKTATTASVSTSNTQTQSATGKNNDNEIIATLQAVRSEMAALKLKVENQQPKETQATFRGTRDRRPKRACKKCTDENVIDRCEHCFYCASSDHWSKGCRQKQMSGNRQGLSLRDK